MKNNATKKALSLLMAALMVFSVLSPAPAKTGIPRAQAADPVPVASWADLKEAVKNGGAIEITENLVADSSITISKDVVITGAGKTIYRKDGNADFPMFSVTNGGKLSLGTGLTLSGQTGTCGPDCVNLDDYLNPSTGSVEWSGTIANFKPNNASVDTGTSLTQESSNGNTPLTFTIGSDGKLRVGNLYVEYSSNNAQLKPTPLAGKYLIALNEKLQPFTKGDTQLVVLVEEWQNHTNKYLTASLERSATPVSLPINGSWSGGESWTIGEKTYYTKAAAKAALEATGEQVCDDAQAGEFKVVWNDGANDLETQDKNAGDTLSHAAPTSPEEGLTFAGWKWVGPSGEGSSTGADTGFVVPADTYGTMKIVAQWEKPAENGQFNVFRSNGASSNEKTATHENVAVDVALKYTPPADWAPENGYVFKGWKWIDWNGNEGSSVGSSDPADTGLKVPSNVYGTLTLIAQWEKPAAPSVTAPVASYSGGYNARIKLGNVTTDLVPVTVSYNQGIQYNSPRKDDLNGTFYISTGRDKGLDSADFASANEWWQGFATNAEVETEAQNNGLTPKQGAYGKPVYSPSGLETFPKYQWHVDGQGRLVNGLGWALSTNESGQVIFVNLNGSGGSGGSSGTPTPYTSKNPVAFAKETQGEGEQYESVDPTWSPAPTPAPSQTCEADGGCKIWKSNEYSSGSVEEPRGFFVKVNQGGTLNITGATLKDFITDASVQNVAPVAVKGGTFSMSGGSIEHNAVGYSADNSFIGEPVNKIEKKIKDVENGWTRTNTAGAIILTHGSQGNITGGTIQNNRADAGAIIVEGDGTAKKNTGTQTQLGLNGGTISNNFGVHYGGAIYIYNNGLVEMNGGAISNNFAWFKGGAVFASEEVFGSTQWGRPGTTQYVGDAAFVMKGGTLSGNMAVSRAGAIEVMSNHVILVDGDIINNSSRSLGGAIYVEGDGVDRMYTLVLQKGCISNNTAVNNVARPTDLSRVFKGNVATDCNFENILGVPGAGANIYDRGDYGGYYGHGGGIWLCSFGGNATFNINETFNVIVDGNHSVAGRGEDIQVHVAKGGSPNGVNIVGLGNNSFVNEATGNPLEEGTHYPGKLSIKNTDNRQSCDGCEGVNISGNVASNGGGIAANGTVVFGSDTNVYVPMTKIRLTKSWDEGVTKETITLKYYYKDENGNRVQLGDLDGYQVTFNGKADSKAEAAGNDQYTENDPTWEQINDSGDSFAEMAIPWVVTVNGEKKATFILGLDNPVTIHYKDARNNDKTFSGKEFDPSNDEHLAALWTGIRNGVIGGSQLPNGNIVSNQLKIVKWNLEVVETNADGEEINFTLPDGEVANLNVEAHKAQEKVFYDKAATRLASVNTSVIGFGFNTNILNAKEEEPKVEKYVNDKVHADLEYFDQVFKYSVMAYVPRNATKVVLTDTLRKDLEFVNTTPETVLTSVVVYKDNDSDANTAVGTNQLRNAGTVAKNGRSGCPVTVSEDKQTVSLTLDEAFLQTANDALFGPNGEAKDLDAVWVKMTFEARIKKDSHAALAKKILSGKDTTEDGISWEKVTTNASTIDSNGTAHTEVANGGEHAGMANKANYKVTIKNKGESSYDTNTVTVVPKTEDLTITKKWEGDTANNRPTVDEFKAALKVQSVKGQTVTDLDPQPAATIKDNGNNTWTARWTGLPKLEGVTYQVAETKLAGYQNPTGSPAKNGETITNTKEKDTTKVKVTKVWENATEAEKTAIQVQLKKTVGNADPVNVGDPVTLNGSETTPWTYTWDGLEIEEEGETIIYTVDEVSVPVGFTKIVAKDGTTGYKITNVKATTEKYVDKDVHSDIVNFDKEFVYDILVYVPKDATEFTITDTLVPGLEFADKYGNPSTEVSKVVKEVVWKTTNDHTAGGTVSAKAGGSFNLNTKPDNNGKTNPATIQDSTLTITIDRAAGLSGARGRWVQVTFYARIQNQYRTLDALKKLTGSWTEITNNTPVISQIGSHVGMRNKAEYTVKFGNNGEGTYETNTVTVKPEMVEYKAQKKWQGEDGKEITWPTGAEVRFDLVKITTDNQGQPVEEIVGTKTITSNTTAVFDKQPKLENASYEVREYTEVKSYQIEGSPEKSQDGTEFTFTNRLTDKDFNPAEVTLAASKTMIGADVKDYSGKFKFVLKDGAENVIETKAINKNGKVSFSTLRFTKTGTYTYTISELIPDDADKLPNIIYDETVKTIEVKVGKLENAEAVNLVIESVTCNGEPVSFTTKANSPLPAQAPQKVTAPVGKFTNIFEQPEIEKYVNKKDATPEQRDGTVHTDLSFFDEVYTYDIQAYVTTDAKYVVVTDQLVEVLQLVNSDSIKIVAKNGAGADGKTAPALSSTAGSVDVKDQCAMDLGTGTANKLVFTFGSEENTEILGFAGQWLQITFDAKIKDEYRSIKALQDKGVNVWNTVTVNDPVEDADCTTEFSGAEAESHEGIINEASYTINKKAGAGLDNEWQYEDKSNTVTVEPKTEELKATKAWKNADGSDMTEWPEGAKVTFALMKGEEEVETKTLDKAGTVTFAAQPKLSSVTYKVVEKSVTGIDTLQDGDPTIEGNTWTFTNKKIGVPEIEKYINQNVHEFINKDDEFTYDIIAYVTGDADKVIITDELNSQLTFVGEAADVKVYDLGTANNHNTADKAKEAGGTATVATGTAITTAAVTINGQKLEVVIDNQVSVDAEAGTITRAKDDVTKLRGHYVRVEFKAALTDAAKADLSTLKLEEIKENAPLNVTDAQKEHEGVANKAFYEIEVGNEGKYKDESNTVTVKPEEPEIEKYVNKKSASGTAKDGGVHTDLAAFDEVYTYDIQAYIAKDATVAEITDELVKVLEFVGDGPTAVVIKAGEAGGKAPKLSKAGAAPQDAWSIDKDAWKEGKLVLTLGKADSTEVLKAAGQWIQITFEAKIKDTFKSIDALKNAGADVWTTVVENDPIDDAKVDNDFSGAKVDSHEGIANDTSYRMKKAGVDVDNTWSYNDKSNTVTVQPKTTKLTVSKEWKTGTLVDQWPEGAEVEVKLTQTKDGVTTEVEGKTDKLTASKTTVIFADLPCLEGVTYGAAEGKVTNAGEYKIGEVKKVSEGVFQITNQREEEPEIEKYVNKKSASGTAKDGGVHTDLAAFYEVFTYDIQAYIAKDATVAEITDELKAVLEFVGNGPTAVVIKAGEAYGKAPKLSKAGTAPKDAWSIDQEAWKAGKLVLTLGKADSTEVLKAAGQWIQITFDARIKDSFKSIDALKKAGADVWQTIVENDPIDDAKVDNDFSGAKVDKHEGIANDTSYRMKKAGVDVGNTWSYNDKSNTVTVQPKTVKVSANKIWIGKPADALRLALRRDGVIIETVTISAGSKWSYEWKSLPAGYKYEVTESVPANFTQTGSDTQVDKDGNVTVSLENTRTTTVKINKTDLGGTELAGAVIEVKDANGEVIATWTSEVGKTMDLNLVPGEYTFREVNAPEGYECVTTEIGFTVNGDGTVTVTTTTVEPAGAVEVIDGVIVLLDKVK